MNKVVFACVHNAGRSQMAAAFFNLLADRTTVHATSAGTTPAEQVHPVVVTAMREVGIDLADVQPQLLTDDLVRDATLLVTMGCGDECPYVPGLAILDWPFADPAQRDVAEVRKIRDEVRARVGDLVTSRGWSRYSK